MAEGRMLKKEISDSMKLGQLKSDRPRVLYFMMLPHLDRDGRLKADPYKIKGQICTMLPYSIKSIQTALEQLHAVGLLILYSIDDKQYLQYTRFHDFQSFNYNKEAKSKISPPTPENSRVTPEDSTYKLSKENVSKDNKEKESIKEKENPPSQSHFVLPPDEMIFQDIAFQVGLTEQEAKKAYENLGANNWKRANKIPIESWKQVRHALNYWKLNQSQFENRKKGKNINDQLTELRQEKK